MFNWLCSQNTQKSGLKEKDERLPRDSSRGDTSSPTRPFIRTRYHPLLKVSSEALLSSSSVPPKRVLCRRGEIRFVCLLLRLCRHPPPCCVSSHLTSHWTRSTGTSHMPLRHTAHPNLVPRPLDVLRACPTKSKQPKMADKFREEDEVLRQGVRQNLAGWLKKLECDGDVNNKLMYKMKFVRKLSQAPVAIETDAANEQHYEVPTEFFTTVSRYDCEVFSRAPLVLITLAECSASTIDLFSPGKQTSCGANSTFPPSPRVMLFDRKGFPNSRPGEGDEGGSKYCRNST